MTVNTTATGTL